MRTMFISLILLFFSFSLYSQPIFIYGENGTKIYLQETDSIVQIKFQKNTEMSEKTDIIKMINPETNISQANNDRIWMPIKKGERYPYDDVKKNNSVIYANQSLMSEDGTIQIPTDKVLIQIRDGYKLEEILKILGIKYENYNHYWDN